MIRCTLNFITAKFRIALICVTVLIAGCSGSSSSDPQSAPADNTTAANDQNGNQSPDSNASNTTGMDSQNDDVTAPAFTRVSFNVTVPAYSSNALQVSLVVGARDESSFASGVNGFEFDNTRSRSGAAYIFINNNGIWEQQAYLKAGVSDIGDTFGEAVSISANGNIVAIGAKNERGTSVGINGDPNDNSEDRPGAVYVFARSNGSWQQQAYVKPSNTDGFAWFGESISLSADGSALAVGAKYAGSSGAAYLY